MSGTKRSYIEVDTGNSGNTDDALQLFVRMLRKKHGGTDEVEESNRKLLESLIRKNHIPRSSILWHGEKIHKIYGFKVDNSGRIEYDSPSRSPPKKVIARAYVPDAPVADVLVIRDAIIRSKQMAI